jgi:hypothetical protein
MLHAWTVSEVTLHTGKNLFLQKMQLLQFCVHWTCPWLQLCHVKVLHEPHENFWNTNICNFGCFIPTQCQSYLIWQNHKFFAIYSCPAQPDFQNLSAVYFSFNCTDKIESFSQNFQQHFFMTPTLWKYCKQENIFPHALTTFSLWLRAALSACPMFQHWWICL